MKGEASLGDKTLAFNFGTFCALEEKCGKKVPELLEAMNTGLGFGELRDFIWAGLQVHHPGSTDDDALKLLDDVGYSEAATALGKAVGGFFGAPKAKGKNPLPAAA